MPVFGVEHVIEDYLKMSFDIIASCKCGLLQFEARENAILQICCHCSDCREATGDPFSTIAFFKTKTTVVTGETRSSYYVAESGNKTERVRCSQCDSIMFDKSEGFPGLVGVLTQRIQAPFTTMPNCHVWIKSKLPQTVLPSGIKHYETGIS